MNLLNLRLQIYGRNYTKKQGTEYENFDQKIRKTDAKVRFVNCSLDYKYNSSLADQHKQKKHNSVKNNSSKNSSKKNIMKSFTRDFRKKPNSIPEIVVTTPSRNQIPDSKPATTKKVPNFAKIHKKIFAKAESIIDAKKRVIDRYTELTTRNEKTNSRGENQLSNTLNKNTYNRFELKIRKLEATDCIMRNNTLRGGGGGETSTGNLNTSKDRANSNSSNNSRSNSRSLENGIIISKSKDDCSTTTTTTTNINEIIKSR